MTTITANDLGSETTPLLVTGYETRRESRTIIHRLLNGGVVAALREPDPRSGDLVLLYATEADAKLCADMHARATTFTLTDEDLETIAMTYVVTGIGNVLEDQTRALWLVTISYQEV